MNRADTILQGAWEGVIVNSGIVLAVLLVGVLLYQMLFIVLERLAGRGDLPLNPIFVGRMRPPSRLMLPLLALMFANSL